MSKNIGRENASDPHFRYKRQIAQAKVEGRGNGIKTNVVNNKEIARQLDRPPTYLLKFFGFELGAQTQYKEDTGLSIVNGSHTQADLEKLVDDFIDHFVICKACKNPETEMKVSTKGIKLKCKACGAKTDVAEHRLNTYIYKHPPVNKETKAEKKVRKDQEAKLRNLQEPDAGKAGAKKDKKDKEKGPKKALSKKKSADDIEVAEDVLEKDSPLDDNQQTCQVIVQNSPGSSQQSASEQAASDESDDGDDVGDGAVFTTDTSAAAAAKRAAEQLTGAAASMVEAAHVSAEELEAAAKKERVRMLISKRLDPAEVYSALAESAGSRPPEQMKLFYQIVLGLADKPHVAVEQNIRYLTHHPDMKWQAAQLIGLEMALSDSEGPGANLMSKPQQLNNVFMTLYNEEVLQWETIQYWFDDASLGAKYKVPKDKSAQIRAILKKTVDEIREDEEASDDEDDE